MAEKLAEAAKGGDVRRRWRLSRRSARKAAAAATDLPEEGQLRLGSLRACMLALAELARRAAAARGRDAEAAAARRADLPHRRLHQLPHRQGRAAARRRRCDREPVRRRSTRPTSRPTRRPGSAAGADHFIRAMREGRARRAGRSTRPFPTPRYTHMTDEDLTGPEGLPRHAAAGEPAVQAARAVVPVQSALGPELWQWAFFTPGAVPARSRQGRRLEPRRLSGAGAGPLRRVPHAAHLLWRARMGPRLCRGAARQGEGAQHHLRLRRPARQVERQRHRHRAHSSA